MHDPDKVFDRLALKPGDVLLDLGAGPGDYSLKAAELVGPTGMVLALDRREEAVRALGEKAGELGFENVKPMLGDITQELPVADNRVDVCLICTVLHIFPWPKFELNMFSEIKRVLKPGARLAVIECKKEDQPWGPPLHMRISPEEMEQGLEPRGYVKTGYADLGKTYLIQFEVA
jgi:ubiquinone/menaquinone biosynthesis C-methylase UbiE